MAVGIGPRIQVEGEEKYRQEINKIIQQAKTLDAEMGALTASFDKNATEQEKAQKSSELLNKQLEVARERTRLVREMTEKATEAKDADDKATLKWREALANAETQQAKLERAVQENTRAIEGQTEAEEEATEKMVPMGDAVDQVAGKLGLHLPEGAKKALNGMQELSGGSVVAMGAIAAGVAVAVKAVKELYDVAVESAQKVDDLETRAAKTGLDADLLQQLDYAQRFLDFENLDSTLVKLTQNMGKARDGADAQTKAFERLGVSIYNTDGSLRDNWSTFLDVIDALGRVENATERDTLANSIFGKGYSDLKPLVDAGTDALTAYMQKAEALGIVLDETEREKLARLSDILEDNEARWDALKDKLALAVAPALSTVIGWIDSGITGLSKFIGLLESADFERLQEMNNSEEFGFGTGVGGSIDFESRRASVNGYTESLKAAEEQEQALGEAEQANKAALEATETARQQATEDLKTMAEAYAAAYEESYRSLNGQFGLWEEVAEVSAKSIEDMLSGLDSQIAYWDEYAANFEDLTSRNIAGVEEFAARFADGSRASAEALAGLSTASDEEIASIISKLSETDQAKQDMAARFAALETDLDDKLRDIRDNFAETVDELGTEAGDVDFSEFLSQVDAAFSEMESRADSAVRYVSSLIAQIPSDIYAAGPSAGYVGWNAAGTQDWRGGLTWVGEAGPELVRLPAHSQVFSSEESRAIAAGSQNITINVQGIDQLDEIVRWYDSRRVVGRMQ